MMRYEWTPASKPPEDGRTVEVWWSQDGAKHFGYPWGISCYYHSTQRWGFIGVTYWRDVAPPNSSATLTGSSERKGE